MAISTSNEICQVEIHRNNLQFISNFLTRYDHPVLLGENGFFCEDRTRRGVTL